MPMVLHWCYSVEHDAADDGDDDDDDWHYLEWLEMLVKDIRMVVALMSEVND